MRSSSWWLLCFGWTYPELVRHTHDELDRVRAAVLATGWLMTLYTIVTIPLAVWIL